MGNMIMPIKRGARDGATATSREARAAGALHPGQVRGKGKGWCHGWYQLE